METEDVVKWVCLGGWVGREREREYMWPPVCMCVGGKGEGTGRRRCIGRLKLQGSVRKRATNYRALLRKMTYKDKASHGSSPPCRREREGARVRLIEGVHVCGRKGSGQEESAKERECV